MLCTNMGVLSVSGSKYLQQQPNGYWYYIRRVPSDVSRYDTRRVIKRTTKKRDFSKAVVIADRFNEETEAFWCTLAENNVEGVSLDAYNSAIKRARALGVRYRPSTEISEGPAQELLQRLEVLGDESLVKSKPAAQAALGTVDRPLMRLSELPEAYFSASSDRLLGKAPDQIRKFKLPKQRAVRNLISVIGDKEIADISREDALTFREWWLDRVRRDGIEVGTANKDIGHLNGMLRLISPHPIVIEAVLLAQAIASASATGARSRLSFSGMRRRVSSRLRPRVLASPNKHSIAQRLR